MNLFCYHQLFGTVIVINFRDILSYRASKGKAIRYLSHKWEIPLKNFLVCGNSGNDEEMLRGEPFAAVVGNYSPELEELKEQKNIYLAGKNMSVEFWKPLKNMILSKKRKNKYHETSKSNFRNSKCHDTLEILLN